MPNKTARESTLSRQIQEYLARHRIFHWKTHGNIYTKKGLVDLNIVIDGKYIGIETKRKGHKGEWSDSQKIVAQEIKQAGAEAYLIDTFAEFLQIFELKVEKK